MSVILVHTGVSHTRIEYSIWEALNQTWPHSSTIARFGTGFSPEKEVDVSRANLIISTSLEAAASIKCQDHQLHMCYLEPIASNQKPIDHQLVNSLTEVEFVVPTKTLLNQNRDRFTSFVRPPVETDFFSSGYERRSEFYLLVVDGPWTAQEQLAVDACVALKQSLSIIGIPAEQVPAAVHNEPQVEIIGPIDDQTLRDQYRLCKAVICPRDVDFDLSAQEAQSCGAPVVIFGGCEAAQSVICFEQHGLGSGIHFAEQSAASLISAMRELELRPQRCQSVIGWCCAAQFSYQQFQLNFNQAIAKEIAYRIQCAERQSRADKQQDQGPAEERAAA
ncbi:glycosyltransferase family 4 protein [Gimesia benthica]|uniref:Glycosyltransferase family 4 protein n=1 Tax=Gimesia benthica TaxID=2608982 RepID=A0A6I6AJH1_9PLAN|nr:glycosyltransferase [Gimesia benthica]QGQ26607.1 glycosyltransferase family 4 protein [Gimesia benthica]